MASGLGKWVWAVNQSSTCAEHPKPCTWNQSASPPFNPFHKNFSRFLLGWLDVIRPDISLKYGRHRRQPLSSWATHINTLSHLPYDFQGVSLFLFFVGLILFCRTCLFSFLFLCFFFLPLLNKKFSTFYICSYQFFFLKTERTYKTSLEGDPSRPEIW